MAQARAHPNIALVKYWGKAPGSDNKPASPSISLTIDELETVTRVSAAKKETIRLNGKLVQDKKISNFLRLFDEAFGTGPLNIESSNNFPTGSGLASSASGFAALVTALNETFELGLDLPERSIWARRGSGSAARSMCSGIATLEEVSGDWQAREISAPSRWPLSVVVAITTEDRKSVSSSVGMERSRSTSPFYKAWIANATKEFDTCKAAIKNKDFQQLGMITESSCLQMHAVMMSSYPALIYWNEVTVNCIRAVREMRSQGLDVFFSIDAGPQIKAICLPEGSSKVESLLRNVKGVKRTINCGLGLGANTVIND